MDARKLIVWPFFRQVYLRVLVVAKIQPDNIALYSFSFIIVKVEEEAEGETDEEEPDSHSSDGQHEYYRQPVYLSSDKCPYLPHVLHFVRLGTGTVLVLVSEVGN